MIQISQTAFKVNKKYLPMLQIEDRKRNLIHLKNYINKDILVESLNDQDTFKIIDSNDETNDEHDVDDDDTCYNEMAWNVVKEIIEVGFNIIGFSLTGIWIW